MKMLSTSQMRNLRLVTVVGFATLLTVIFFGGMTRAAQAQQFPPPGAGYLDYNYGVDVNGAGRTPTESKPESKLWWNDGFWWGSLWNPTDVKYHIYRLNWGTQTWEDTGVPIDDRKESRGDTLWDATNKKLYVASHFAQLNPGDTNNPTNYARLYRYSYNDTTHTYALDAGFPVNVNHDKTEALTLAKDSTGRLWVTYVSRVAAETPVKYRVYVNASNGSDTSWDPEGALDLTTLSNITTTARVASDDISAIVSFKDNGGNKVGILWSNQFTTTKTSLNFIWHLDSNTNFKTGWTLQPTLNNLGGTAQQSKANDHMNVKSLQVNNTGQVFAAIKFENQVFVPNEPTYPEIGMLARDVDGTFVYRKYSTVADNDSRPLLLIDEADTANNNDNVAHLFVSGLPQGSKICYKDLALKAPPALLSTLGNFPTGNCGNNFIVDASGVYTTFRDPSSTKQSVNNTTGLVVIASDVNNRTYAHNVMGNPPPVVTAYGPKVSPVLVTSVVTATFSKPISSTTLTNLSFQVTDGVTTVPGTISYNPNTRTAIFTPNTPLKAATQYTVKLTNDIKDTTNLRLDAFKSTTPNTVVEQFTFNTGLTTVQFARPTFSVLENGGNAVISVTLASPASQAVTVNYATSDNTAKVADGDYTASSGTLTFNPGETAKAFVVPIINDNIVEGNEAITLTLSSPSGANPGVPMAASLTIIDDEGPATVQFAPTSYLVKENDASGKVVAIVSLNHSSLTPITVDYATSNGTATAGQDYTAVNGTLTFAAGDITKTIEVQITSDNIVEPDEAFNLVLSNPTGASLGAPDDKATVQIQDTSTELTVQFDAAPYTVGEADGTATITVKLSSPSATAVTVDYATSDGTATTGEDYTAASGTLSFAAGETTKTFAIPITDNTLNENNETVNLTLSNPTGGAALGEPSQTTLTINDDDAMPTVQFNAATYTAGENAGKATITVQLSAASGRPVEVSYISSDGTATDGSDYAGVDDNLTIPAGETSATFDIILLNDNLAEPAETVNLSLNTPSGATLGNPATAVLTILDDDSGTKPTVQFSSAAYSVNEGAGTATVTVTLSAPSASVVSVSYATVTGGTATDGSDYSGSTGTLSFAVGQLSKTFTVPIKQDTTVEGNETVNLALTSPSASATLGTPATAVLTIVDDDVASGSKLFLPIVRK